MESGARIRLIMGRAAKAIDTADRTSIAETGLNVSDFSILEALLHKGPLQINTIGEKVLLSSGSMTAAANRLEKKGLVKRIQDPSDGRCFYLHLTKPGRQLIKRVFERHSTNLEKIAGILTTEERGELVRLLKKIGRHAQTLGLT
jgi:MarR family 2-MHQ and catechol resistance regulon transcriptional repressor